MKEKKYANLGQRIKAIREHLKMTLADVSEETGISRSYISDFERGFKLPTAKYLKYLHNNHNINLNYIFCSDEEMYRKEKEEKYDFGKFNEEIEELLFYLSKIPPAIYAVLGFFTEYKLKNKEIIDYYIPDMKTLKKRREEMNENPQTT
ncbi:MAG: helix-turn-helix domain-containing protein [Candidatus Aminicenantes bacterium]|nr:helix-turn-helix domain-containing protein [Candidatus Aminicenantes bacterium]NIM82150.1 helix-turn-helix domain-containing protein [Candidatus Aminicenantes bacterium]NIN21551.1 helix-turn-helix domain-containing protein [Candidatus Aminicenantes bacterium]NIN45360.1 helix-turn-helix domain-containing protein [Candidatus Aminicenantes bacterium]NIN88181.1 helix-turn-helix domain-containing protein [Candidatus Aminicenantes bacterium]